MGLNTSVCLFGTQILIFSLVLVCSSHPLVPVLTFSHHYPLQAHLWKMLSFYSGEGKLKEFRYLFSVRARIIL